MIDVEDQTSRDLQFMDMAVEMVHTSLSLFHVFLHKI